MAFGSSVLTHKKEQQIKIEGEFKPTVDCLYAGYNVNQDARLSSSSGAVFSLLAENILSQNGTVYGVKMSDDCYSAEFARVTDMAGLVWLRGSKYLQAKVGNTYKQIKDDLLAGKLVLFSGTGCQVNGLKNFLGKEYDNVFDKDWPELPFAHREHIGCTVDYVSGRNRYMGYLISLGIYSFKGVKVGLDCANGSSWNIAKSVFDALGADTYVINNKPNGTNINNNAGSTHIEGLQKFVVENGLDVGFAFDGDADRCLCVDEKGNVITGDHILYIYGCYMKERGKLLTNTVVTTVMSNFGLYKAFDEQGIGYAKTAVGDKYVYEYMAKNGCRIGGEQSGHIIFSKYASTGDGILTSLKMMEVMLAKKKPMSELAAPLKIYPQVLENVRVTDKKAAQNDPAVQEAVSKVAEALGDTGRILVRESGTEPVVRVMVEAPDHDTCQKYVSQVVEVIKAKGYVV